MEARVILLLAVVAWFARVCFGANAVMFQLTGCTNTTQIDAVYWQAGGYWTYGWASLNYGGGLWCVNWSGTDGGAHNSCFVRWHGDPSKDTPIGDVPQFYNDLWPSVACPLCSSSAPVYGLQVCRTNNTAAARAYQVRTTGGVVVEETGDYGPGEIWCSTYLATNSIPNYQLCEMWFDGAGKVAVNCETIGQGSWGTNTVPGYVIVNPFREYGPPIAPSPWKTSGDSILPWGSTATGSGGSTAAATEGTMRQGFDQLAAVFREQSQAAMNQQSSIADVANDNAQSIEGAVLGVAGTLGGISNIVSTYLPGMTNLGALQGVTNMLKGITNALDYDRQNASNVVQYSADWGFAQVASGVVGVSNQARAWVGSNMVSMTGSRPSTAATNWAASLGAYGVLDLNPFNHVGLSNVLRWARAALAWLILAYFWVTVYQEALELWAISLGRLLPYTAKGGGSIVATPWRIAVAAILCGMTATFFPTLVVVADSYGVMTEFRAALFPFGSAAGDAFGGAAGMLSSLWMLWEVFPVEVYVSVCFAWFGWKLAGHGLFACYAAAMSMIGSASS